MFFDENSNAIYKNFNEQHPIPNDPLELSICLMDLLCIFKTIHQSSFWFTTASELEIHLTIHPTGCVHFYSNPNIFISYQSDINNSLNATSFFPHHPDNENTVLFKSTFNSPNQAPPLDPKIYFLAICNLLIQQKITNIRLQTIAPQMDIGNINAKDILDSNYYNNLKQSLLQKIKQDEYINFVFTMPISTFRKIEYIEHVNTFCALECTILMQQEHLLNLNSQALNRLMKLLANSQKQLFNSKIQSNLITKTKHL